MLSPFERAAYSTLYLNRLPQFCNPLKHTLNKDVIICYNVPE